MITPLGSGYPCDTRCFRGDPFETGQQSDMILHIGNIVTDMESTVFYLTGLGGKLDTGLGQALRDLGVTYSGISYSGSFEYLSHSKKLLLVKEKLSEFVEMGGNKLVAVSAGGLLIVELLEEVHFPNLEILLLSPVLPNHSTITNQPKSLRIIFGSDDYLYYESKTNNLLNSILNSSFLLVDGAGHFLPHDIVRDELISWIE